MKHFERELGISKKEFHLVRQEYRTIYKEKWKHKSHPRCVNLNKAYTLLLPSKEELLELEKALSPI